MPAVRPPKPAVKPHVARLELVEFGVFANASLDFVQGINVFLGANGTGKSHAMKVAYSVLKTFEAPTSHVPRDRLLAEKLANVFRPDDGDIARLIRRKQGKNTGQVWVSGRAGDVSFTLHGRKDRLKLKRASWSSSGTAIFLPTREVLAMYEGFAAAYQARELAFDETYYDACVALGAASLRGPRTAETARLLAPLEEDLGGKVVLKGSRFYVALGDGNMEAHLVAEGLRKLASVAHLVANGSLRKQSVLFWDEPEANLNPRLIEMVTGILLELARQRVQVFVTTHDYLLSHRLSVLAEHDAAGVPVRFFAFHRDADAGVIVSPGDTLPDLPDNPIVEEFLKHYQFERSLGASSMPTKRAR